MIGEQPSDDVRPRVPSPSDLLHDLALRVQRLSPSRRDPEHFHIERSDVVHEMRKLAQRIGGAR